MIFDFSEEKEEEAKQKTITITNYWIISMTDRMKWIMYICMYACMYVWEDDGNDVVVGIRREIKRINIKKEYIFNVLFWGF